MQAVTPKINSSILSIDKAAIQNEVMRLQDIQANLTVSDLSLLDSLTNKDPDLHQEYMETKWIVEHNFSKHVSHSLNSIYWMARDGRWLCPADTLSHVGLYLQYNEIKLAKQATEEGKEKIEEWKSKAEQIKMQENPLYYQNLTEVISSMKSVVSYMGQGNYEAAKNESFHLGEIGYC